MAITETQARPATKSNGNTAQPITPAPDNGKLTLREVVQEFQSQLVARQSDYAPALPPHISPDRFRSAVTTAVNLNPDLIRADRLSLFNACTKAAQDGLMPDGREGALVIFNTKVKVDGKDVWIKKVTWMPMVYGIIKKARQSGEIATLGARIVYEKELESPKDEHGRIVCDDSGKPLPPRFQFFIKDGEDCLIHDPIVFGERGAPVGVYARVKFKDGAIEYEILNKAEVEKMRSVSKSKDNGPWVDWWEEMAKKSAIRRLAKRLPLSAELVATISRDDELSEYEQIKAAERSRLIGAAAAQLSAPKETTPPHDPETGEITDAEVVDDDTEESPIARAQRLLALCKTAKDVKDLVESIADELADDAERATLEELGQLRMKEI